jgi:transposase
MITLPRGVSAYAYFEPCDMRKSFNTLSGLVAEGMKLDLLTGDLFLFVSKDRKRTKVLYFDGTGLCLFSKRLDQGRFTAVWKRHVRERLEMTLSELALFIEGSEAVRRSLSPPLIRRADIKHQPAAET